MAKWMEVASRAALDELLGETELGIFTWGTWHDGTLRFYADGKLVGIVRPDQLPALIRPAAALLQYRGPA